MALRGELTIECDVPACHAELVIDSLWFSAFEVDCIPTIEYEPDDWRLVKGRWICPDCCDVGRDLPRANS